MASVTDGRSLLLCESNLHRFATAVLRPNYDRKRIVPALVHIGVGAFNRSHLAVYLDDLLTLGETRS
jgi:hypothetical protein